MDDDLQKKFAALISEYSKNLPGKINEMMQSWKKLQTDWNPYLQLDIHTKIHGLKGSARIYGYEDLSLVAEKIEKIFNQIKEAKPSDIEMKELDALFKDLKNTKLIAQEPDIITKLNIPVLQKTPEKIRAPSNKKIFILAKDNTSFDDDFVKKLSIFGYDVEVFISLFSFTNKLKTDKAQFLIVDIDEVMDLDVEEIKEFKNEYIKDIPIIFISRSSEFHFRLRAVQLLGAAFLLKPFLIGELVDVLKRITEQEDHIYRVLIIDDDPEVANFYSTILNEAGMLTTTVTKAVEIDKALHEFKPELIISDFHMPECDGLELATIIRQQRLYENMPFIFLSSEDDKAVQLKAMSVGVDDFIVKGSKPEHLILTIKNKADRSRHLQTLLLADNLTGLLNHTAILNKLESEVTAANENNKNITIAMIDVDHFSELNNQYGHAAGDQVLKMLSFIVVNKLRPADVAGRLGDDNFLLIMPDITSEQPQALIEEIKKQFSNVSFWWDYRMFTVTFSACLASYPEFNSAAELIDAAYEGLRSSKLDSIKVLEKSK